jgi:hypothetical protein
MIEVERIFFKESERVEFRIKGTMVLHREDGPAVVHSDKRKEWWLNGRRHREGGPAYETPRGYKEWFLNGVRHRDDGPAIIHINGMVEWYLNGIAYTKEIWFDRISEEQRVKMLYSEYFIGD